MDMSKKNIINLRCISVRHVICVAALILVFGTQPRPARADCVECQPPDCILSILTVLGNHSAGESLMAGHMSNRFGQYRDWLIETFFTDNVLRAMMMMTEQLSAVGMYQMFAVGALMDAKIQLDTQRLFQELQVQAIKDYQPSDTFCYFGTNIRSLSASQNKGIYNKMALNKASMNRLMGESSQGSAGGNDARARWNYFVANNCQVFNNNWAPANPTISGLQPACATSKSSARANADVQYGRFVDYPRTIDVDFTDGVSTDDEHDIIALSRNIYGHKAPSNSTPFLTRKSVQEFFYDQRAVAAKRNVAQNSFNTIVGLKSSGTSSGPAPGANNTTEYMAAILHNLGLTDPLEIEELIGENPSYLAQLEILAKRVYQDQSFYANLYDKPENVGRTSVAMRAIDLMVEREMYESRLRKEMLISVLLSAKLEKTYDEVESVFESITATNR